jgi:hypothetical protein
MATDWLRGPQIFARDPNWRASARMSCPVHHARRPLQCAPPDGPLGVGSASSQRSDAAVRPRTCRGRRSAGANDRNRRLRFARQLRRTSSSKVDRSFAQNSATGSFGSTRDYQPLDLFALNQCDPSPDDRGSEHRRCGHAPAVAVSPACRLGTPVPRSLQAALRSRPARHGGR